MILDAPNPTTPAVSLAGLVDSIKRAWRQGDPPDAARAIQEHPELLLNRSLAVDLAYEDYCLREEAGQTPETEAFCERLPAFGSYVREVIRGHRLTADHPEIFARAETEWPHEGENFDGLKVERELGRGAFARVYLALDPETGDRPVALKISPAPSAEARTLGPIDHPHVVTVHWARRVRGLHVVCMPFVGATTLGDVIEMAFHHPNAKPKRTSQTVLDTIDSAIERPQDEWPILHGRENYPDAVAAIASRLAGALAHLHRTGISHGDLKPSNIILGAGGHPYLIDFNLSTTHESSLLKCGGTLTYMAPERIRLLLGNKDGGDQAAPTDIYSLGVILFEALTGRMPVEPPSGKGDLAQIASHLLKHHSTKTPNAPTSNPMVPRALARLLDRCLESDPQKRITAEALKHDLDRYLRRRTRRYQLLGGSIALLATGFFAFQFATAAPQAPSVPEQPRPAIVADAPMPTTADEFFKRGAGHLKKGDWASAIADFGDARRLKPDGQNTAYLAYALSRTGQHPEAAALYLAAIEKRDGYENAAWVFCNRAYSLIKTGKFELAIEESTNAINIDKDLRPAHWNRVFARFQLTLNPKTQTIANPEVCFADLDPVMDQGPRPAELCFTAAQIYAACSAGKEQRLAQAVRYLREAVEHGKQPLQIAANPVIYTHLSKREDFQQVCNLTPAKPEPIVHFQFVDPLTLSR